MKRSRNEIRERRGKFVFLFCIFFPLSVVLGYYALCYFAMVQFGHSLDETMVHLNEQKIERKKRKDYQRIYANLLVNKKSYTYSEPHQEKEFIQTSFIQVQTKDSSSLQFEFHRESDAIIKGTANLDHYSIGYSKWKVEVEDDYFLPAYRFIQDQDSCYFEILITKNTDNLLINKIFEKREKELVTFMHRN